MKFFLLNIFGFVLLNKIFFDNWRNKICFLLLITTFVECWRNKMYSFRSTNKSRRLNYFYRLRNLIIYNWLYSNRRIFWLRLYLESIIVQTVQINIDLLDLFSDWFSRQFFYQLDQLLRKILNNKVTEISLHRIRTDNSTSHRRISIFLKYSMLRQRIVSQIYMHILLLF